MQPVQYILDTNVLLSDPEALYAYPGAHLTIPLAVIEEIDQFKKEYNERGRNARIAAQMLDQIRLDGSFIEGIKLSNKAVIKVYIESGLDEGRGLSFHRSSNRVLQAAKELAKPAGANIVLVTNDMNLRVRAAALGLQAISHDETEKQPSQLYEALRNFEVSPADYKKITNGSGYTPKEGENFYANQNLVVSPKSVDGEVLCRYHQDRNRLLPVQKFDSGLWGLVPKNYEQAAALDFLMDESISIVTLAGKAGTGKTLLALAAALELMLSVGEYQKILVSRPIFPLGRDMGYLPGDIDEKMAPWMQPIFDNLEFLFDSPTGQRFGSYERLQEKGLIELEPLTYIRGRSISRRVMIVDEAQNLTPHELKTIVTRVGEGTKLILTGDPYQIDNPYIDPNSNGLSYVIQKFRNHSISAHVTLLSGVRSGLAELASNIL